MEPADLALEVTATLAAEIGPRRPTSAAETAAARAVRSILERRGVETVVEEFSGYDTFARVYAPLAALALVPSLLPGRMARARAGVGLAAAGLLAAEGGLVHTPISDLAARRKSTNVVASVEPSDRPKRTLCLMAHLDTSRSGLLFEPRLARLMRLLTVAQSVAITGLAGAPVLERSRAGRALTAGGRALCAIGLALLFERELRGEDVPGANDNASGTGAVVQLVAECAASPLASTRVVALICGCEESGLLGSRAFLERHDTEDWIFVNFDGVGAPATLRYLPREGIGRTWPADPALVSIAEGIRAERPELGLEPADAPLGLTYDATAVLARGGRALTLVAGDAGKIPNYHQPSDSMENLDPPTLGRALAIGRELIARIDRGEAG